MAISPSGATVWRDYSTDGVPASGAHKVQKNQIRAWSQSVETLLDSVTTAAAIFDTRTSLYAALSYGANTLAWVVADSTASYNGIYRKTGASGSGLWGRVADLPYSFIVANDVGAGAADAIQATTSIPVSDSALVILSVFEGNTASPVTVSFNGGTALTIKTNSGNDIAPGGLLAGMLVLGRVSGSTFRLASDQASAAILAQAEDAATRAEEAAAAAEVITGFDGTADSVSFDNAASGLAGDTVQEAIDELTSRVGSGDDALLALAVSEANSNHVALRSVYADGFNSLGMVDVAGGTNLDTSEVGYLKPTTGVGSNIIPDMTGATTSGVTMSASEDAGAGYEGWRAGDRDNATFWQNGGGGSSSAGTWVKADFGSAVQVTGYSLTGGPSPGGFHPTAHKLQYSADNSTWVDADSRSGLTYTAGEKKTWTLSATLSARYWRILIVSGVNTTVVLLSEWELFGVGSPASMTVASEILPSRSAPDEVSGFVRVVAVDAVTLNTDLFLDVRRDQADSWSQATLALDFTDGGVSVLNFDAVDVSSGGVTGGPQWRVRTANAKMVKIDGVVLEYS